MTTKAPCSRALTASRTPFPTSLKLATILVTLIFSACASKPPEPVNIEKTKEATATVESVNVDKRLITLLLPDGEKFTVEVDPGVRNLAQVKAGDHVIARYYEALAAQLRQRGDGAGTTEAPLVEVGVGRAIPGGRPGGFVGTQSTQTVRITNVDIKNHVVSFYGSDGLARSIPVLSPQGQEFIGKLKKGDEVELTYTEAVAISIEPAE